MNIDTSDFEALAGRAVLLDRFGGAEQLRVSQHAWSGDLGPDEILVRNHATSVNPIEWKMREGLGLPHWLWRRLIGTPVVLGLDFAGEVVAAGAASGFSRGDSVMGASPLAGAYAEFVRARPANPRGAIVGKPGGIAYDIAGVLPFAGRVALAGLAGPRPIRSLEGAHILVVGASGGVGHLAVQIAKRALDAAFVAGICSERNADFVRDCGADEVVTREALPSPADIAAVASGWRDRFDLIFDATGIDEYFTRAAPLLLNHAGRFVAIAPPQRSDGRPGEDRGPFGDAATAARLALRSRTGRYRLITGLLGGLPGAEGLGMLAQWLAAGVLTPRIGARFDLSDIAAAHRLSQSGGVAGKIAVSIASDRIAS